MTIKNIVELAKKLTKQIRKALFFIPSKLPTGMTELDAFTNSILDTYDLPNNESTHFAIANMVMHSGATQSHIPKRFFGKSVMNAMAKEVAFAKEAKLREERKQKLEASKAQEALDAPTEST